MIRTRSLLLGVTAPILTLPLLGAASAAAPPEATPSVRPPSASATPGGAPSAAPTPVGAGTDQLRDIQQRLEWLGMAPGPITGTATPQTEKAIRRFQKKFLLPVVGKPGKRTVALLRKLTPRDAAVDPRCLAPGKVICLDKSQKLLRAYENGAVVRTTDVRFGGPNTPTREGSFKVDSKSRYHVSSLYDLKMPYAMFFSGGQAVHFSPDFAERGYNGSSHGCVNVRSTKDIAWVYKWAAVGTRVVVYRSVGK